MTATIKYATWKELVDINQRSIDDERNRNIDIAKLRRELESRGYEVSDVKFPVVSTMDHNDIEARVCFSAGDLPMFYIDMPYTDYNNLSSIPWGDA